ncbi:MAG: hypothetical protein KJN97_14170 [Deltaproteobacteria bacterium]|nr:hypothetical protein [Deltaproteobacteria bacterium]
MWAVLWSLFGVNCAEDPSTQLVVLMDTDYRVPDEVDRVRARVAKMVQTESGPKELPTWVRVFALAGEEPPPPGAYVLPATFAVLPAGSDVGGEVVVELEALARGSEQPLVVRRVRTGFMRGEARLLRMLIHSACEDVLCGDAETCGCPDATSCATPSCVDERVLPDELELIGNPGALPPNSEFPVEADPDAGVPNDDGIPPTDGGDPDGGPTDGVVGCEAPFTLCDEECVNLRSDPRYCGDCGVACPSGYVCELGGCTDPGDCRTNGLGCNGFTYCDGASGDCLRGCTLDEQCARDHELCDAETHECVCEIGFDRCGFECINTLIDPRFCGDCGTPCPPGQVCELGGCNDPGDCRINGFGCTGFTYCDGVTGSCLRGCENDTQCTAENRVCDTDAHNCVCDEGFHSCGGTCVSDFDVESCGDSCMPCPSPPGSTPTCDAGLCGLICDGGREPCGFECVDTQTDPRFCAGCATSCPLGDECESGVCVDPGDCRTNGLGCSGFNYCDGLTGDCLLGCEQHAQCSALNEVCNTLTHECVCIAGFHSCGGVCVSDSDVASCGTLCAPCPTPPSSTATCELGVCDFVCSVGFERCDDACCPTSCPEGEILFDRACAAFHIRAADSKGNVGEYASLALDAVGRPHAAYYAQNGKNLLHSRLSLGGIWSRETAAAPKDVGQHASIEIDPSNVPHIAFYDADTKDLRFAVRLGSNSWSFETVDGDGDVGQHASLAFDLQGTAHIAYYDGGNKSLRLATKQPGGGWSIEVVDAQGSVGRFASLAFSAAGAAHIAYHDEGDEDLLLATEQPGGRWSIEVVDAQGSVGRFASLAFDNAGVAHVAYYDEDNGDLKLATRQSDTGWKLETVDGQGDVGSHGSLAFDAAGTAHISYFDETSRDLKHTVRQEGQPWRHEILDSLGEVGRFTSLAVDAEGHVHIAYYDSTNTNLKYAIVAAP